MGLLYVRCDGPGTGNQVHWGQMHWGLGRAAWGFDWIGVTRRRGALASGG